MCIKFWNKQIKKMKWQDIVLIKLSVFFGTLFLITVWPGFKELTLSIDWYWYLILMIVLALPIFKKVYLK